MFTPDEYQLIDFGQERKLERFGALLVDRPAPNAPSSPPVNRAAWRTASARFIRPQRGEGHWEFAAAAIEAGQVSWQRLVFELRFTPFGHVGLFPEQAYCWAWIQHQVQLSQAVLGRPVKVLNLFAYTGGSSLAAAAAGAEVTHVDAARNIVEWARHNARLSALDNAPVRWIVEDAMLFVSREVRRNKQYDALILDPPSYGHGPQGQVWKIEKHLEPLLRACRELLLPQPRFLLLTCHSPGYHASLLAQLLTMLIPTAGPHRLLAEPLDLLAADQRRLPTGALARWPE